MNKYLEKIAETYSVKPTVGDQGLGVKKLKLNRQEMDQYRAKVRDNQSIPRALGSAAVGAAAGALVGNEVTRAVRRNGPSMFHGPSAVLGHAAKTNRIARTAAKVGAGVGAVMGLGRYADRVREKSLEDSGLSAFHRGADRSKK